MGESSLFKDWETTFQKLENVLRQCEPSKAAAPYEAAYKAMLSWIITELGSQTKGLRIYAAGLKLVDAQAKMRW